MSNLTASTLACPKGSLCASQEPQTVMPHRTQKEGGMSELGVFAHVTDEHLRWAR